MSNIAKTQVVSATEIDATVAELAAGLKYEAGGHTLHRLPTDDEARALADRLTASNIALRSISYTAHGSDMKLAGAFIAEMFQGFVNFKPDPKVKEESIGWYVHELRDMPLFAIEAACRDVREARVPDLRPDYPPSSARMVALARVHAEAGRLERATLKAILSVTKVRAPDYVQVEVDKRVGDGLRQLATTWAEKIERDEKERSEALAKKTIDRNRQEIMEEHYARGVSPIVPIKGVPISISLRKKIAEFREQDERLSRDNSKGYGDLGS